MVRRKAFYRHATRYGVRRVCKATAPTLVQFVHNVEASASLNVPASHLVHALLAASE